MWEELKSWIIPLVMLLISAALGLIQRFIFGKFNSMSSDIEHIDAKLDVLAKESVGHTELERCRGEIDSRLIRHEDKNRADIINLHEKLDEKTEKMLNRIDDGFKEMRTFMMNGK